MKNILNLFEEFLYIINDRYSEVMCAKYGRSRMNDACTVCPADFVSLPAKVVWLLCWPSAGQPGSQLMNITTSRLNIYFRKRVYMSIKVL